MAVRNMSRTDRGGDRGLSAIIVALGLTGLLSVSALAVDVSQAYAERRHDQNTVDAAAMSGLVEAVIGSGVANDVVAEIRDKVNTTLGRNIDDEWAGCKDDKQLHYTTIELQVGNPTISPVTECISFSVNFDEIRVKLPRQTVPGVFGPAVGFADLLVDAAANAKVVPPGSGAPPFVALSTATQGDFVCLRTSSNPEPLPLMDGNGPGVAPTPGTRKDPCDSTAYPTSSENFGTLQPYRYKENCTQQNSDMEDAVSIGIDHTLGFFDDPKDPGPGTGYVPGVSTERFDGGANCTVLAPNTFEVDTGFNAQGLRCALLSSKNSEVCNGLLPRLHQGDYVQSVYKFAVEKMDNIPPWNYLRPAEELFNEDAPDACVIVASTRSSDTFDLYGDGYATGGDVDFQVYQDVTDSAWDHYDKYDKLVECLESWDRLVDPELFTIELGNSPRFAFIPQVYEPDLSGVTHVHIEGFLPTYMYRLYQATTGGGATPCDPLDPRTDVPFYTHDAGQQFSCASNEANVDRLSSIIFACGMVPDTLCNKETDQPVSAGRDYQDFRLVK